MKKLNIFMAVAIIAAMVFTSCNSNKAKLPTLKTQLDSLNYAFGVANGDGIKNYYICLLYTSPSPRDRTRSRMPSSA